MLDVRKVLADLRPPLLEEQGLAAALDNEIRVALSASGPDVLLEVVDGLYSQRWPSDVEYSAFMVVREAIANARLHAHASLIRVVLEGDTHQLNVEVIDDGVGIDPTCSTADLAIWASWACGSGPSPSARAVSSAQNPVPAHTSA